MIRSADILGMTVQVDSAKILDAVSDLVSCYTRPETNDLIVDSIHLEDSEIMSEFSKLIGISEDRISQNQYIILWR